MALVAFDLDNTLGFFYHISIWADFFSVKTVENKFNRRINPDFSLRESVKHKMQRAQKLFIKMILKRPALLKLILRPNLSAMIIPIIEAKRRGDIDAVCIYSNSWNPFALDVAKEIIETIFNCKGLFDCLVDATHPIRSYDWKKEKYGEPSKNFITLKAIFRNLCKVKDSIEPSDIMFVDERAAKHDLKDSERDGLVYLKPTSFSPTLTNEDRREFFMLGLDVLDELDLLDDSEYLDSDLFHCKKYSSETDLKKILNIYDLLDMSEKKLRSEGLKGFKFKDDTREITKVTREFLRRF